MPRMRKTPKPKKPTCERIDPKSDSAEMYVRLAQLRKLRPDLDEARIALEWRYGWKKNRDGQLILGRCRKVGESDKQWHGYDFVISFNHEAWQTLEENGRDALMYHELCHAAVSLDGNGNLKKDARGRQAFRIRKHDIEEFGDVVDRFGCYKSDLEDFVRVALNSKRPPQLSIPELAEPSTNGQAAPSANGDGHPAVAGEIVPAPVAARMRKRPAKSGKAK